MPRSTGNSCPVSVYKANQYGLLYLVFPLPCKRGEAFEKVALFVWLFIRWTNVSRRVLGITMAFIFKRTRRAERRKESSALFCGSARGFISVNLALIIGKRRTLVFCMDLGGLLSLLWSTMLCLYLTHICILIRKFFLPFHLVLSARGLFALPIKTSLRLSSANSTRAKIYDWEKRK